MLHIIARMMAIIIKTTNMMTIIEPATITATGRPRGISPARNQYH